MSRIAEYGRDIRSGRRTCVELVERTLEAAASSDAFVELLPEDARRQARNADSELTEGIDRGPLHGIPFAVKDNTDVAASWTRCGTPAFGHHWAQEDATVVERLRAANAVPIGKTRTHELAWGMVTPGCRNPRSPDRMTGGSSGGSAAAVAAGIVPFALGTDTGGSVRNPAALCGVSGAKAAAGALPTRGIAPLAPTQDSVGVLAETARDCGTALKAMGVRENPAGPFMRAGVIADRWARRVEPSVSLGVERAAESLRRHGVEVVEISIEHSELATAASYVTMLAEAAREWWPEGGSVAPGALGTEVRDQLLLGSSVTQRDYGRARDVAEAIQHRLRSALREVDVLLLGSCPVPASPIGAENTVCAGRTVPVATAHAALTSLASVTGFPAVSVPGDGGAGALPVGVQLIGADVLTLCHHAELCSAQGEVEHVRPAPYA